jgi:DNA-binding transcriptional MerR regulator
VEKVRYMISDAAGLVNVEAHVLRYWEEELELDIPRNELGHRYYTKENIEQFLKIKEWKEKGYQLKAIKMLVHEKSTEPEAETETRELLSAAEPLHTEVVDVHSGKVGHAVEDRRSEAALSRMEQFQMLMTSIVKSAIEENNHALGKEVGDQVGDRVLKEMNYLMREQDEQEEERYRKLDETIRIYQKGKRSVKRAAKREAKQMEKQAKQLARKRSRSLKPKQA